MRLAYLIFAALAAGLFSGAAHAQFGMRKLDNPNERWYITKKAVPDDIEAKPLSYHPNLGYKHSDILFKAGKKPEAVYWMYLSQIRYRIQIDCRKLGPWTTDYDTYVALNADINSEQNAWVGGDIQLWADTVYKVKQDYDHSGDEWFSDGKCAASSQKIVDGFDDMLDYLVKNADDMRTNREDGGLENRTTGPVADPRLTENKD